MTLARPDLGATKRRPRDGKNKFHQYLDGTRDDPNRTKILKTER